MKMLGNFGPALFVIDGFCVTHIFCPVAFSFVLSRPKGVMTSFKAMTDTTKGLTKVMGITSDDRYISYLPIAHGMERWLGMVRLQLSFSSFDKLLHFRLFFPQTNFFNIVLFTQCAVCSILHGNASLVCRGSYHLCC